jgi:hypothetical protein
MAVQVAAAFLPPFFLISFDQQQNIGWEGGAMHANKENSYPIGGLKETGGMSLQRRI